MAIFPSSGIDHTATQELLDCMGAATTGEASARTARRADFPKKPGNSGDADHKPDFDGALLNEKGVAVKQHFRGIEANGGWKHLSHCGDAATNVRVKLGDNSRKCQSRIALASRCRARTCRARDVYACPADDAAVVHKFS